MLQKLYLIVIVVSLALAVFGSLAQARTVTLVYDDSGSMSGNGKWIYANYAAQSLAALLDENDELYVLKMSQPVRQKIEKISINSQKNKRKSVKKIRKEWREGNGTPYKAVSVAVDHSIDKCSTLHQQDNDWLVVMTDGGFDKGEVKSNANSDIQRLLKDTKGKVRVIFFLIGNGADKRLPEIWEKVMPIDIVPADEKPEEIINSMGRIAAIISGRDNEPIKIDSKKGDPETVKISSPFPIKKIIAFEQRSDSGELGILREIRVGMATVPVELTSVDIKTPWSKGIQEIEGRISQLKGQHIFPAGLYELKFDRPVQKKNIKVMVEAAIDFSVTLYGGDNKELKPKAGNVFEVCAGEQVTAKVMFMPQGGGGQPLSLDAIGEGLKVRGDFRGRNFDFLLGADQFSLEAVLEKIENTNSLSVEARYPGYFHYKSNILTINGVNCTLSAGVRGGGGAPISLPYIWSDTLEEGAIVPIVFEGDDTSGTYILEVDGLPAGVALKIKDKLFTREQSKAEVTVQHGIKLDVRVMRNVEYRERKPFSVTVTAATDRKNVKWIKNRAEFDIQPVSRDISGVIENIPWIAPVTALDRNGPLHVQSFVDGQPVSAEEWSLWKIVVSASRLSFQTTRDKKLREFLFVPEPSWGCECFSATGDVSVVVKLMSPFPGEEVELPLSLTITDVSWWVKCRLLLLIALILLLILWYLIRLFRKDRFANNAVIDYAEIAPAGHTIRQNTERLAGHWFNRVLLPSAAERKMVEGISFRAGKRNGYIILPQKQQRVEMSIDDEELENPGRCDKPIRNNCSLEMNYGTRRKLYKYLGN